MSCWSPTACVLTRRSCGSAREGEAQRPDAAVRAAKLPIVACCGRGQWQRASAYSSRMPVRQGARGALVRPQLLMVRHRPDRRAKPRGRPAWSGMGLVSRASPVQTAVRNCTRDEGGPFGFGDQVADPKPPQAAVVKSHGGERCGNAGTMIPAGTVERGERKRTVSEVSKAD